MRIEYRKHRYVLILLIFLPVLTVGCRLSDKKPLSAKPDYVEELLSQYRDTMFQNPLFVKAKFLDEIEKTNDSLSYYKLTSFVGFCYFLNNQMDSAFLLSKSAIAFYEREKRVSDDYRLAELAAHAYNNTGVFFQDINQRDSAILYLQKAVEVLPASHRFQKLPGIFINLADNYNQNGDFISAIDNYRRALSVCDTLGLNSYNHSIYYGMARIYTNLKNYSAADHYYQLAFDGLEDSPVYDKYMFYNNRGYYYYQTKEYEKSLKWFRAADSLAVFLNHPVYPAIIHANLGEVFLLMNQADSAQYYLDQAGTFFLKPGNNASMVFYYNGLSASLALLKNDLKKAENFLSKPYDASVTDPTYIYLHHKRLEELYAKKGDYKKAYEFKNKVELYNDSLHNITVQNNIAEIDSRYRKDTTLLKRDIMLGERTSEALKFRNFSIILIGILVIVVLLTGISIIYLRRKRERLYARQLAMNTKLRMENIRNRVSPHYIFNVLNVIMPAARQYEELAKPLNLLIASIRYNLLVSEKITITLNEELKIVRNYIDLRKSTNLSLPIICWELADNLNMEVLIPSMIIQIPVENAIKYAFESMNNADDEKSLTIKIDKIDDVLHIFVIDNGVGYHSDRFTDKKQGTGTGLKVLFNTIELLNTKNTKKIELKISNRSNQFLPTNGTEVSIIIPSNYNFNL